MNPESVKRTAETNLSFEINHNLQSPLSRAYVSILA